MGNPLTACLHTKQIAVIICIGEEVEGENCYSKSEQYVVLCVLLQWLGENRNARHYKQACVIEWVNRGVVESMKRQRDTLISGIDKI
jgi:hypothetical protein